MARRTFSVVASSTGACEPTLTLSHVKEGNLVFRNKHTNITRPQLHGHRVGSAYAAIRAFVSTAPVRTDSDFTARLCNYVGLLMLEMRAYEATRPSSELNPAGSYRLMKKLVVVGLATRGLGRAAAIEKAIRNGPAEYHVEEEVWPSNMPMGVLRWWRLNDENIHISFENVRDREDEDPNVPLADLEAEISCDGSGVLVSKPCAFLRPRPSHPTSIRVTAPAVITSGTKKRGMHERVQRPGREVKGRDRPRSIADSAGTKSATGSGTGQSHAEQIASSAAKSDELEADRIPESIAARWKEVCNPDEPFVWRHPTGVPARIPRGGLKTAQDIRAAHTDSSGNITSYADLSELFVVAAWYGLPSQGAPYKVPCIRCRKSKLDCHFWDRHTCTNCYGAKTGCTGGVLHPDMILRKGYTNPLRRFNLLEQLKDVMGGWDDRLNAAGEVKPATDSGRPRRGPRKGKVGRKAAAHAHHIVRVSSNATDVKALAVGEVTSVPPGSRRTPASQTVADHYMDGTSYESEHAPSGLTHHVSDALNSPALAPTGPTSLRSSDEVPSWVFSSHGLSDEDCRSPLHEMSELRPVMPEGSVQTHCLRETATDAPSFPEHSKSRQGVDTMGTDALKASQPTLHRQMSAHVLLPTAKVSHHQDWEGLDARLTSLEQRRREDNCANAARFQELRDGVLSLNTDVQDLQAVAFSAAGSALQAADWCTRWTLHLRDVATYQRSLGHQPIAFIPASASPEDEAPHRVEQARSRPPPRQLDMSAELEGVLGTGQAVVDAVFRENLNIVKNQTASDAAFVKNQAALDAGCKDFRATSDEASWRESLQMAEGGPENVPKAEERAPPDGPHYPATVIKRDAPNSPSSQAATSAPSAGPATVDTELITPSSSFAAPQRASYLVPLSLLGSHSNRHSPFLLNRTSPSSAVPVATMCDVDGGSLASLSRRKRSVPFRNEAAQSKRPRLNPSPSPAL